MRRSILTQKISSCIETFLLNNYRIFSHLDENYGGAYYWNERDVHWALYRYLRERTQSRSIGSEWCVHAEGEIGRPRYFRKEKWKGMRRADIVFINHREFKRWWKGEIQNRPPYQAMIEIKMIWSGSGRANTEHGIRKDIKKLEACLNDGTTKNAFFILLDGLDGKNKPYFQDYIKNYKKSSSLVVYHWPDSNHPVENPKNADFAEY